MRKHITFLIILLLLFVPIMTITGTNAYGETRALKTRTIHVVYDDSGSMVDSNASWSQAKYALEVFAAMMNENDRLVIYPMTAYSIKDNKSQHSGNWHKTITLTGSMALNERIEAVRHMNGDNGTYLNTPIQTVQGAGDELRTAEADEKWLLVLTDGAFDNGIDNGDPSDPSGTRKLDPKDKKAVANACEYVKKTILGYAGQDNIRVYFIGIQGVGMNPLEKAGLSKTSASDTFYKDAANKEAILGTITKAARTIYNLQTIPVKGKGTAEINPDIPVAKYVIFAQGDKVKVGNLQYQGKAVKTTTDEVDVEVSAKTDARPANKPHGDKFADNLKGEIVTYLTEGTGGAPFPSGKYSFDCKADTVEVYFEPGVDIQILLVNTETNEEFNLSNGVDFVESGSYAVRIQMVNPLTGDIVDASSSDLLKGVQLSAAVTTDAGTKYYADGDLIAIDPGDMAVQGRAVFRNDSEKTSDISEIHVGAGGLLVEVEEAEYEIDPLHLKNAEIKFRVTDKKGVNLSAEEYDRLSVSAGGVQGLNWTAEKTQTEGLYRLVPQYAQETGANAVNTSTQNLTISAAVDDQGYPRTGTGSATVSFRTEGSLEIILDMKTPEAKIDGKYMFDASEITVSKETPYILVTAQIQDEEGSRRPLTTQEWEAGFKSFAYESKPVGANMLWKLIGWICRQKLDFKVSQGDDVSTYKLYLTGITPVQVRPHTSNLTVRMKIKLDNGILEEGETSGDVTVKPLGVPIYIGWLLALLAFLLLLLLFIVLEYRKPRLPRNLVLRTSASARYINGKENHDELKDTVSKVRRKHSWFPPTVPEEGSVSIRNNQLLNNKIRLQLVADKDAPANRTRFKCTNAKTVWPKRNGTYGDMTVTINGTPPEELENKWVILSTSSSIYIVLTGKTEGEVSSIFTTEKNFRVPNPRTGKSKKRK